MIIKKIMPMYLKYFKAVIITINNYEEHCIQFLNFFSQRINVYRHL